MLSRDNPNVNKIVEKMINDAMKKVNAELLNIRTCNLHVIHNGFKSGMDSVTKIRPCLTMCVTLKGQLKRTGTLRTSVWIFGRGFKNHLLDKKILRIL
jgi:hypothetical protein